MNTEVIKCGRAFVLPNSTAELVYDWIANHPAKLGGDAEKLLNGIDAIGGVTDTFTVRFPDGNLANFFVADDGLRVVA